MKLETKVGAFFLATIAILGLLVLRVEKLDLGGGHARKAEVDFDSVAGLALQSAVRVAGVKVGEVRSIELKNGKAEVTISVEGKVQLHKDATATLSSIGILGEKYIELSPGTEQAGLLEEDGLIASRNGANMDTLLATLQRVGENVEGVTYALNKSIGGDQGRQKLDEIVDNIRTLTAEFRQMAQENHQGINNTVSNVETLTGDLKQKLPELAQRFDDLARHMDELVQENRPELKATLGDVRKLAQSFESTSQNLKDITGKIDSGQGTLGKLVNDDSTIKKINAAVDNVNEMLGGFKALDLRLDLGGADWTKRHNSATYLGVELAPRDDYWYQVQLGSTPDGKINNTLRTVTTVDPVTGQTTSTIENDRYVTADQTFTFSAQFAKRWGPAVLSAGIIESKGGGGAELRFNQDKLRFGVLAYDFEKRDDKPNPRYRFTTSYQFWKGAYVQAGLQDIANKDLRTFFIGGGLRWKDEDLKKLIGLAASSK